MKKILLPCLILLLTSCQSDFVENKNIELSNEIRKKFKSELIPLKDINFYNLLGRKPSVAEIELGRQLFNDPIISRNNDVSCATCHLTNHGFADGNSLSIGALGKGGPHGDNVGENLGEGKLSVDRALGDDGHGFRASRFMFRNTPSTINIAYRANEKEKDGIFWDGRFGRLNFQVLLPFHTAEELCGTNPVPSLEYTTYLYGEKGPIFKEGGVRVVHSHAYDPVTGADRERFNYVPQSVIKIPMRRTNGVQSVPTRNECLALAVAKIKLVPGYRKLFAKAFRGAVPSDRLISNAISSFVFTHVSKDTPYDRFVAGKNALTDAQLKGYAIFTTEIGESVELAGKTYKGAGCASCHQPPDFGGSQYFSLGVRSDARSALSRPTFVSAQGSGFFARTRLQRGEVPRCHIKGITISGGYAPDIGRAGATYKTEDCFKFRVPPLRNVIETYPYFHHGTARAQGFSGTDLKQRSMRALEAVIDYHLRGPINATIYARKGTSKVFFDKYYQKDGIIPFYGQQFSHKVEDTKHFPIILSDENRENLLEFVATGLFDPNSVAVGALGNDVTHPKKVLSGFTPSITRDNGTQNELPPNRD